MICLICKLRERDALTKHHLIPKNVRNKRYLPVFTPNQLAAKAILCRACHSALHLLHSNQILAEQYYDEWKLLEIRAAICGRRERFLRLNDEMIADRIQSRIENKAKIKLKAIKPWRDK